MNKNFMKDWECIDHGPSFIQADIMFIHETLVS